MSTHYITSSTTLYVTDSVYYSNINNENVNVTVIEEGVGTNCQYHYVSVDEPSLIAYYGKNYYVLTSSVYRLEETAESAPRICISEGERDRSYEPEDWINRINIPFLDKKEQKYYITVISNYKTLNEFENLKQQALKDGVRRLLEYYYKDSSDEMVDKCLSYYKFATFEQYHIPFQPNLRIRCQISIDRKYLDAIEDKQINLTEGNLVFNVDLINLEKKITKVVNLLKQYHKDMIYYRFKSSTVNLKRDYEGLLNIIASIKRYLGLNKIPFFETKGMFEFSVDNCFNVINVSYWNQVNCEYIKVGLSQMVKESPFNNQAIVNFLYQLNQISKIEYCNLSWIDFVNEYYFPQQNIPQLQNPLDKYTNSVISAINSNLQISVEQFLTKEERAAEIENLIKINFKFTETLGDIEAKKRTFDAYQTIMKSYRESLVIKAGSSVLVGDITTFLNNINKDNIIEKLKQIKLCEISCQALECISLLIQIDIIDELKVSLSYDEQKNDLIPSLTNEEKKILFTRILNNRAITNQTVYRLLKQYETDATVLSQIKSFNNDELIEFLIGYMVN
jgi:hypothetical protein